MAIITVVDKPAPINTSPQSNNQGGQSARERAMAALMGSTPGQSAPVQDPSKISVEELKAASPTTENTEISEQTDTKVEASGESTTPSTDEVTPPTKEEPLSTQYAVLARKEKALRAKAVAQEQQYKQREAALSAREAELASKSNFDSSKYISIDELKQNAYGKLSELGISYDDISQQALTSQSPEAQAMQRMREEMRAEIQKVREEQANTRKSYETQQAQAYQQALTQIRNEATQLVNTDPNFETIKETGAVGDVVELIERTFKEDGTLLTVEQAAQAIEDELMEEALKITRIKKIQEKLKSKETPKSVETVKQPTPTPTPQPQQQMKTLTNSVGSTRPLTAKERALLAFKGELNK